MSLILVPSVALRRRAKNAGVELAPVTPMLVCVRLRSSTELTGTVCHTSAMATSKLGVPSQLNLLGS